MSMTTAIAHTWQQASAKLRQLLNEDTYDRWISGIVPLEINEKHCRLGVSNSMFSEWLNMNYKDVIANVLEETTGRTLAVSFESGHDAPHPPAESRRVIDREILVWNGVARVDPEVDHTALLRGQRRDYREDQRGERRNVGTHTNSV